MKVSFLFPVFLAATQFVIAVGATGAEETGMGAEPAATPADTVAAAQRESAARDAEIIRRYDTNGDGKLDEAEVAAAKEQMLMATQEKREQKRERVQERLRPFDTNGDGQLDETERRKMDATLRARAENMPRLLKRLDTDGDGKLSDAEWAAGRDKVMDRLQK